MNESGIKSSFKAYDIRGKVPGELDEELSYHLGLALAAEFAPARVVLGRDVRLSGPGLVQAMAKALVERGVEVIDTGVCGTEEIYFATAVQGFDLGVMFTASHNPAEYNGIKMVKAGAVPVSSDSGLFALRDRILAKNYNYYSGPKGSLRQESYQDAYLEFLRSNLRFENCTPVKAVMNPGNGCAGPVLEKLIPLLPGEFTIIQGEPDGTFPNGIPNPLLPERRKDTAAAVRACHADLGLAWDGDFDRCFFYDSQGNFIESYYLIGLLAQRILADYPGAKVIHDTRLFWNTADMVRASGGVSVMTKTGHAFMKERMRREDAVYGGEMSAHHYFKNFSYCDSGMLPWIKLLEIIDSSGQSLSELVEERMRLYPCSGEINFKVSDSKSCVEHIHKFYASSIIEEDRIDGLSAACGEWRFNLRSSNTEPLLRLNIESRGDSDLVAEKVVEISNLIHSFGGVKSNG